MALPPLTKQLADHLLGVFCAKRLPADLREQIRVSHTIRGNAITIHEHRVAWDDPRSWTRMKVAVLQHNPADGTWELFCFDRNARRRTYCASYRLSDRLGCRLWTRHTYIRATAASRGLSDSTR